MEIILAKNAVMFNRNFQKPTVELKAGDPHAKFIWNVFCFPKVASKCAVSDDLRQKIMSAAG